jgi:hypothetical protein
MKKYLLQNLFHSNNSSGFLLPWCRPLTNINNERSGAWGDTGAASLIADTQGDGGCVLTTADSGAGTHLGNRLFTDTNHDRRKLSPPKPGLGVTFDPKKASLIMEITSNTKFPYLILKSTDGPIHNW